MTTRTPFVPQLEMAECGAACLAMVLGHYGCHVPLAELRADCGIGRDGVTAQTLQRVAAGHGLAPRGLSCQLGALATLPLPAILHWDFNHFVVIARASRRGAVVLDPAVGRRWLGWEEIDQHFTGVVLTFAPTEALRPRALRNVSLRSYWSGLWANRAACALLLGSALLLQLLVVLFPSANQLLIDHVLPPERRSWLWVLLLVLAAGSASRIVFGHVRDRTLALMYLGLDLDLMARFTDKLFALPLVFFDQRTPGDLMQRVQANSQLSSFGAGLLTAGLDLWMLFVLAGLMLAYDPRLASITLGLSLLRVLAVALMQQRIRFAAASELGLRGRETSVLVDAFSMPEVVRAFGLAGTLSVKHTNAAVRRTNLTLQLQRDAAKVVHASSALEGLSRALLLYLGGVAVLDQRMSIGAFVAISTLQGMLEAPLAAILQSFSRLGYVRGQLARLADVMDGREERFGNTRLPAMRGEIELRAVGYRYSPGSPKVCDDLSVCIAAGEKIAIVGRSGSGKSTLAKLMIGLIEPSEGEVAIDGVPLSALDVEWLRRNSGVVLQEPFLFDESVRANVDLLEQQLSPASIQRALAIACLDDVVAALPRGIATPIGERGRLLSGGQRQRLVLARAIARAPAILVLDEATSSLDPETESRLHENLAALGCTRIIVAHRLATVRDADRILVLDQGRLVQTGNYEQLIARDGPFRELAGSLA